MGKLILANHQKHAIICRCLGRLGELPTAFCGRTQLNNAYLKSGNNVTIMNVPQFDATNDFGVQAANRLTVKNVTGKAGTADFQSNAGLLTLDNWHIDSKKMFLNGTDIYNDPNYLSALVHGRLVKKNTPEDEYEADEESEEEETTIGGNWLSVSGGTLKTENFLNRFDETNPAIVPIMNNN